MMKMLLKLILKLLFRPQKNSDLILENLALRQQLVILKRPKKRLQIRTRDRLDHVIVLNESHLSPILASYFDYYHYDRTHYGLGKDTPAERPVQPRTAAGAKMIELPRVGGLHHRYEWKKSA